MTDLLNASRRTGSRTNHKDVEMGTDAAFAILGIAVDSQAIEITRTFRALSRESHPDMGGDPQRFTAIVGAYRTLQRAGLVSAESADGASAGHHLGLRSVSTADRYYRRFMQGLHRAAARTESPSAERLSTLNANRSSSSHDDSFEAILQRELLRVG